MKCEASILPKFSFYKRGGYALSRTRRGQRAALQHQPGALTAEAAQAVPRGRTERGPRARPGVTASPTPTPQPALPAHGHPGCSSTAGAGASPTRGTCPLRDPAQDAAATRNRNPSEARPPQEARASHAGSGKLLFRLFPPAWCAYGGPRTTARAPSRAAASRSAPVTAQRGRPHTRNGAAGWG